MEGIDGRESRRGRWLGHGAHITHTWRIVRESILFTVATVEQQHNVKRFEHSRFVRSETVP